MTKSTPAEPMGGAAPDAVTAEVVAAGATASEVDVSALQARITALEAAQAASPSGPKPPGVDLADHLAAQVAAHPYHDLGHLADLKGEELVQALADVARDNPDLDLSYVIQLAAEAA